MSCVRCKKVVKTSKIYTTCNSAFHLSCLKEFIKIKPRDKCCVLFFKHLLLTIEGRKSLNSQPSRINLSRSSYKSSVSSPCMPPVSATSDTVVFSLQLY